MKTKYSLGSALIALLIFISGCAKQQPAVNAGNSFRISAGLDDYTRTSLDGRNVVWKESDRVACLCFEGDASRFSLSLDNAPVSFEGSRASFEISTLSGMKPRILLSPSYDGYKINAAADSVCVPIPDTFAAMKGDAPEDSIFSLGEISGDGTVNLKNLVSFLRFTIETDEISKIRIKANGGEGLSGNVWFSLSTLQAGKGGSNTVDVIPIGGGATFEPGDYYVPVPARKYSSGLTVSFFNEKGEAAKKGYSSEYEVKRNKFISMGRQSDWDLVFQASTKVISIVFRTGTDTSVFPFSDKPEATSAIACPAVASVAGKGLQGPFYLVGCPGVPFYFNVQNTSGSKSYFISQSKYGMRLGGTPGDYISIPGIQGYRLTKFYFEQGNKTSWHCITSDEEFSKAAFLTASDIQFNKDTNKTYTFSADQTAPGTAYRFCTSRTNESAMGKIELTYESVED